MKNIQFIVNYKIYIEAFLVLSLSLCALYTDIKSFKIPNKLNLIFIIFGLAYNLVIGNIKLAVIGLLLPMVMFPLFAAGMIGAGDVKLFCALGAISAFPNIIRIMAYSIFMNGIIAVFLLIFRRQFSVFKKLFNWIKYCIMSCTVMKYQVLNSKNKSSFRYAYGITVGCVYYVVTSLLLGGAYALL